MGVTVWGDPKKNNFLGIIGNVIKECGFEVPNARSNFHMY